MAGLREDSTVLDWVIAHEDSFAVESNDSVPLPTPRPSPIQSLKPKPTSDEAIEPELTFDQPPLGGEGPIAIAECLTSASARTHSDGSKHAPIMLETIKGLQASPASKAQGQQTNDIRRLAADKMSELTASLPMAAIPISAEVDKVRIHADNVDISDSSLDSARNHTWFSTADGGEDGGLNTIDNNALFNSEENSHDPVTGPTMKCRKPTRLTRTLSTPPTNRRIPSGLTQADAAATRRHSYNTMPRPLPLFPDSGRTSVPTSRKGFPQTQRQDDVPHRSGNRLPSPIPPSIPLPPMSLPTLLHLELAGHQPSPLYIHHSRTADIPYESYAVKFERLKNFLLLPTYLERTMNFGALACLDAWLWTLTILPIRFCIAAGVLARWWAYVVGKEVKWLTAYVWRGLGRMWKRARRDQPPFSKQAAGDEKDCIGNHHQHRDKRRETFNNSLVTDDPTVDPSSTENWFPQGRTSQLPDKSAVPHVSHLNFPRPSSKPSGHRRKKSTPSTLTSFHKADLLQGAVIICSSVALMNLDASRMYHFIRAQSAVKLYVIYNLVEVGDRLLSAVGQDVFECLFSSETLSRNASGRSKIVLPFGMFLLSLVYNVAHSIVLFYQVITLNVAVNSYSNALLSLLMSNQFVEVKSSVFKRTEKENTFQLACADIVERFQLWIVLFIIALRNIVEIGGLSVPGVGSDFGVDDSSTKVPLHNASILPASFTLLPSWLVSGEVLSPFLIVIGSEMVVDWIKHGYINKFNNIKPNFYGKILDILCKDYYTNAFVTPALTRRLGLPLIPLCTLFIRSSIQTYHMFLATHLPSPFLPSTNTSVATDPEKSSSPAVAASLERLDTLIRNALGRSVYGNPCSSVSGDGSGTGTSYLWSGDHIIAGVTMVTVFFITFLILLTAKLLLGMVLLRYSRNRYARMKVREHAEAVGKIEAESFDATGKRTGGFGKVEVGEERRRWIFQDDPEGLAKVREKERKETGKGRKEMDLNVITRYEMIAKRIW